MATLLTSRTRAEWLAARSRGVGASEAAVVMGCSPWMDLDTLWAQKLGLVPPTVETDAMRRGKLLEPVVLERFATTTGLDVEPNAEVYAHDELPCMLATPDAFVVGETAGVEAKTGRGFDAVPRHYAWQVQHQIAVLGWTHAYLALLDNAGRFQWWRVERDDAAIEALMERVAWFWGLVTSRTPPAQARRDDGTDVVLDDLADDLDLRAELVAHRQVLDERIAALDERIKHRLGDAEAGTVHGEVRVTWKTTTRERLDTTALKQAEPELAAKYTVASQVRTFLVK